MEKKSLWKSILWASIIVQITMSTARNTTETPLSPAPAQVKEEGSNYAWSSWSSWSRCSRTCGGGVSVQERQCLPRSKSTIPDGTLAPPIVTVRVTRQTHSSECLGVARRYHQCHTEPCPGSSRGLRAEQCAAYDRRPFRGHFYTWVPYVDVVCVPPVIMAQAIVPKYRETLKLTNHGDSPCTLNCRPLGQHFYASLALVADGTTCTKPGFRAICVQGVCKVVGRETVLAGGTQNLRCGRRLVSGLFSRPRLPLGYSYVTTVPRGACRLNVSEIVSSENYIALKISNGSYIMNGEFAVSLPGTYEAAGSRFIYSRAAGLDQVFALGPIHHPIDIMILYTQPSPNIKYEYFTESIGSETEVESTNSDLPDPTSKHTRRHHSFETYKPNNLPNYPDLSSIQKEKNDDGDDVEEYVVGGRKFLWKILSYTQCTRTCGGGIQLGKYRCVESSAGPDREVSSVHCSGSPPVGRRRRCGGVPCPPRWRAAAWTSCPECGPASRTRIVGCVQDHARGITKISDQKCPALKPPTVDKCNIPDCDDVSTGEVRHIEPSSLGRVRPREQTDTFRDGPVYTVAVNSSDIDVGPEYSFSAAAGWLYTHWSECVGWCVGTGVQTRGVRCADPSGCAPRKAPEYMRTCTPKMLCEAQNGEWFVGEWSRCSSNCAGRQVRGVLCIGGTGRHLRDSACTEPRPQHERECGTDCSPSWYYSDWGKCTGNCSTFPPIGIQRRSVVCARGDAASGGVSDADCTLTRPEAHRTCEPKCTASTLPPDLTIESQKSSGYETTISNIQKDAFSREIETKDCEDKLSNCVLAVQARLCHYKFYVQNCCDSCRGR